MKSNLRHPLAALPQYLADILFCVVLLPLTILLFPVERWWSEHEMFVLLFVLWLYVVYFVFRFFVVPRFFAGRKSIVAALAVSVASVAATSLFTLYEIHSPYHNVIHELRQANPVAMLGIRTNEQAVWIHYIIVVCFGASAGLVAETNRQRERRKELELQQGRAEIAMYRAQINPHFLFNTLNSIYGLVLTHSHRAAEAMERFINIVKYTYSHADKDAVALSDEVKYIGEYIALQSLRLNDKAQVEFVHDIEDGAVTVPTMMLMTFVENAFKYGISPDEPCFVRVKISGGRGAVLFECDNSMVKVRSSAAGGHGIDNCRRRLALLCPGRHVLEITSGSNVFHVALQIKTTDDDMLHSN